MSKITSELAKMLMESSDWTGHDDVKAKLSESTEATDTQEEVIEEASDESANELAEAIEEGDVHVCPLCETVLEDELSDEVLENHISYMSDLLSEAVADEDSDNDE